MEKMENRNLLILGAGQYGTVVKEIALALQYFEQIDFLDDGYGKINPNYHEEAVGKLERYETLAGTYGYAIVAMGNPKLRRMWTERLKSAGYRIPVLVSPRAYVSPSAQLQEGCVVEPLAGVQANALVGAGSYVSMGAIVNHNSIVMDFCHVDCGAIVESGAVVQSEQHVPAGMRIAKMDAAEAAEKIMAGLTMEEIHPVREQM